MRSHYLLTVDTTRFKICFSLVSREVFASFWGVCRFELNSTFGGGRYERHCNHFWQIIGRRAASVRITWPRQSFASSILPVPRREFALQGAISIVLTFERQQGQPTLHFFSIGTHTVVVYRPNILSIFFSFQDDGSCCIPNRQVCRLRTPCQPYYPGPVGHLPLLLLSLGVIPRARSAGDSRKFLSFQHELSTSLTRPKHAFEGIRSRSSTNVFFFIFVVGPFDQGYG